MGFGIIQNYRLQYVTFVNIPRAYYSSHPVFFLRHHHFQQGIDTETSQKRAHHLHPTTTNHHRPIHDCAAEEALRLPPPCGRKLDASAILYVGTRRPLAFVLGDAVPVTLDLGDASPFDI